MSRRHARDNVSGYNSMPRSMRSTRTKTVIANPAKKSSSAVSSRTYSRIANSRFAETQRIGAAQVELSGNEGSLPLNESYADLEELKNEKELLDRMLDQQKQLQELKERQKRVLLLQQQLADVEASAEESLEEKLDKLQTAKSRLDELQQLVSTIKMAEMTGKGEGDRRQHNIPDKATRVRNALQELNELKDVIGMMSVGSDTKETTRRKPTVTLEPVFPNAVRENDYQPVLPEVSIIRPVTIEDSPAQLSLKSPKRRSKDFSQHSPNPYLPYYNPKQTPTAKNETERTVAKTSDKKPGDLEGTLRLVDEMKRHQKLLEELKDRRRELEALMNMTNGSEINLEREKFTPEDECDDTNASVKSVDGSDDENNSLSDADANEFKVNQNGQLFGLSEVDTRRVIDLIRNQKAIMAGTTDKTTATWGSSTSGSDDEEDQTQYLQDYRVSVEKASKSYNNESARGTSVKDAFTQINQAKEHEIDFRPPTRRRRNITQSENRNRSFAASYGEIDISRVQDELHASNSAMHILLEDQQALSKLLLNTLALQQSSVSNKMCYGISPDFLIYQLDNCSAQLAAILKESKDIQWQLYNMAKESDVVKKVESGPTPRNPLATLPYVLNQQNLSCMDPSGVDSFQLRIPSTPNGAQGQNMSVMDNSSLAQPRVVRNGNNKAQKEVEDAEADLFETLRDSIYSEAAILISQNESRPHFLIELFHTLQQLNTDYLRQHALYVLQDVVKGYLSNSPRRADKPRKSRDVENSKKLQRPTSFSENTPSESGASGEEEMYGDMQKPSDASKYDFALKVSSASDLSSPSDDDVTPFAAEDLGSTVIHLDAALRHMREVERWKQEIKSSDSPVASPGSAKKLEIPSVNTKLLRVWIKNIVSEIIPILKSNHDKMVDKKLVKKMHKKVFQCVSKDVADDNLGKGEAMKLGKVGLGELFACQLKSILDDCLSKFVGQRVGSCGEDVIVGLSEVLFNELAFFYMMQDLGKETRAATNGSGDISSALENSTQKAGAAEYNPSSGSSTKDDEKNEDSEASNGDEGAVATEGSAKNANFLESPDPVTLDLSVSETKPLTSYGSGEDEEDGSGEDYDYKEQEVCTSMQQNSDNTIKLDETSQNQELCEHKPEASNSD